MIEATKNAFLLPDLRRKIIFTLLILVVYRAVSQIPVPTVDSVILSEFLTMGLAGAQGQEIVEFINLLAGGALLQFSVLAMGVYPYITASIIMQLLTPMVPYFEELAKEGEQGRNKITQYTYWMTVPLAAVQAYGQIILIQQAFPGIVPNFGSSVIVTLTTIFSMTAGSMFAVWLGEQITESGVGNGVSIIIFGGIVTELPRRIWQLIQLGEVVPLLAFTFITVLTILAIVVFSEGQRRIPVQYGRRVRGTKVYGGQSTHVPLKVNSSGMIPLIFAQSLMIFPGSIAAFLATSSNTTVASIANFIAQWFSPTLYAWPYWIMYFVMVALFTFFYTDVTFKNQRLAENLQRQGGFIPGLRPGKITNEFLITVLRRITLVGAVCLGAVAVSPWVVQLFIPTGVAGQIDTLLINSAGLLIVVGVALDTMKQLESQLLMRKYEGFIK
ncbi:MAG: preprotein translocase subunit SecY [Anaerolineaceae bacterium 4572_78]|nr:MAG: preprotein translocase subunit SecY [Anaerolineaceae bacterium 4572_78]